MTIWTNPVRRVEGLTIGDYTASPGDYLSARAREAWERNPFPSGVRIGEIEQATGVDPTTELVESMEGLEPPVRPLSPMLSAEEATARGEALGLKFSRPTRAEVVDILMRRKKAEIARQSVMQRSPGGFGLESAALGTDLLVTAADPLNIASAFIPVVREARFAAWARSFGPTAARLGRGAIEGAAGAALIEPLVLAAATQEQADYDMTDSLLNIAFGTVLGGGLHAGGGALADVARRRTGALTLSERLSLESHGAREAALRTAVAQTLEGRQVNVEPMLAERLLGETSLSTRRERFDPGTTPVSRETAGAAISGEELQRQAAPEAATLRLAEGRGIPKQVFASREAAQAVADRRGVGLVPAEQEDGSFTIQRLSTATPLRDPDGKVQAFKTRRAAQKFIDRTQQGDADLTPVPFGPAGERQYAIVRNATADDLKAIRARPEAVRFPEVSRERITRQEPTALLARRTEPTLDERINAAVQHSRDPRQIALADFRAADRAEEVLKQIPVDETADTAQQFLEDAAEQVQELRAALGVTDEEFVALFKELDESIAEAEALGRAAKAAALCELRA